MDTHEAAGSIKVDQAIPQETPDPTVSFMEMDSTGLLQSHVKQEPQDLSDEDLYNYSSLLLTNSANYNAGDSSQNQVFI